MQKKEYLIDVEQQRNYKIVKANEMIQKARCDLNISELKMMAFIFSKIKPTDTELKDYTLSVKEYCLVIGADEKSGGNYEYIKQGLKKLRDKSFWLINEDGNEDLIGWIDKVRINKGTGKIKVKLDERLQKFVIGLQENYFQYSLLSTLPMQSRYSFLLFELLKSYAYTKKHIFDIDDLKTRLSAQQYVNFKDFRKNVLELAVREINRYTDIETSWTPIFKGRKVIQVQFDIKPRSPMAQVLAAARATDQIEGQLSLFDGKEG